MITKDGIIGKRCIVRMTQLIDPKSDDSPNNVHEVEYSAVVVHVGFAGEYGSPRILVMYADGSLGDPGYSRVRVIADDDGEGPYR